MKRLLVLFTIAAFLLAIPASHLILGKAHVPGHKVQACHKGKVINVAGEAFQAHRDHGDCRLPACDFNNVFRTGDDCSGVGPADTNGNCTGLNARSTPEVCGDPNHPRCAAGGPGAGLPCF